MPSAFASSLILHVKATWDGLVVGPIFDENPTPGELVKLSLVLAAITFVVFQLLALILSMLVKGPLQKTVRKIARLEFNRPGNVKQINEAFGWEIATENEYCELCVVDNWPGTIIVGIHHTIGGLCAVPSVLGMVRYSQGVRSSLACLGIIIEMAYEIQDVFVILFYRFFMGKAGKKKYPTVVIVGTMIHHSLTLVLGLPMIYYYRELPYLHKLVFDLLFAAGLATFVGVLNRTLDVLKKKELVLFVFASFLNLAVMLWTRFFDWLHIVYKILGILHADGRWVLLATGGPILLGFSVFNLGVVADNFQRFFKFFMKLKEFDSLSETSDELTRESSARELQIAAADLASIDPMPNESLIEHFFGEREEIERRHTFNSAELSQSAASAIGASSRRLLFGRHQSMVVWRNLPSRVKMREEKTPPVESDPLL